MHVQAVKTLSVRDTGPAAFLACLRRSALIRGRMIFWTVVLKPDVVLSSWSDWFIGATSSSFAYSFELMGPSQTTHNPASSIFSYNSMQFGGPLSPPKSCIKTIFESNGDWLIRTDTDTPGYLLLNEKYEKYASLECQYLLHLPLYYFEDSPRTQRVP